MKRMTGRIWRYSRVACHVGIATVKVRLFWHRWPEERRRSEIQRWSQSALGLFGFQVTRIGEPIAADRKSRIIVANHTSWLDIFAIMSHTPVSFVAKQELKSWPIFGNLATGLDTIFLCRDRRSAVVECLAQMSERLADGTPVGIFPEGTTTDGTALLPFHASLFEAAARSGATIQPVVIRYLNADATPATAAAFTGDMSLVQSFQALIDCRDCKVEITYLPPITPNNDSRQALAAATERAIRRHLALSAGAASSLEIRDEIRSAA